MVEQQVEELQISIEEAKRKVDLANTVLRLQQNSDYKKIFSDAYFVKYAARLVALKASMRTDEKQLAFINAHLNAIGTVQEYLRVILAEGQMAQNSIKDAEAEKDILLSEEEGI